MKDVLELVHQVDVSPVRIFLDDLHFHSPIVVVHPVAMPIQASMVIYGFRAP